MRSQTASTYYIEIFTNDPDEGTKLVGHADVSKFPKPEDLGNHIHKLVDKHSNAAVTTTPDNLKQQILDTAESLVKLANTIG